MGYKIALIQMQIIQSLSERLASSIKRMVVMIVVERHPCMRMSFLFEHLFRYYFLQKYSANNKRIN